MSGATMTTSFLLPDLGEGVHEAEILSIPITEGQSVEEGDVILEVETDKAAVEIPSPCTGIIETIKVSSGDMVRVGDVLIIFANNGEGEAKELQQGKAMNIETAEKRPGAATQKTVVPAAPSTRRIAREQGVDLQEVHPTGPNGLVTTDDVRSHAGASPLGDIKKPDRTEPPAAEKTAAGDRASDSSAITIDVPPLPDFSQWGEIERQPFRSIRRATANRMAASWSQIPHVNCQDVADITRLEEFRQRHKKDIAEAGGRLTMTVFAMKAVATALKNYPRFNASLDQENQQIIIKKYFHIGIAVDTGHGLMVPVIRDVDRKSIKEISIELHEAIIRARERSNSREEMMGGTFTITNAGAIGGGFFSAIINHPEVAILGLGQGRKQPAVVTNSHGRDEIVPRLLMPIVLCFDHRVADGADAIRFQRLIIDALEDPDELLITMI